MRIALGFVAAALCAAPALAGAGPGVVDWERRVVKCTGSGAANLREADGNVAVARIGAEKVAKLDALRNCLETLKGVQLQSGQTVGGALQGDAALSGKVEGFVRGFRQAGRARYFSDGGVEIDVEVPLEGGLSDALLPRAAARPPSAAGPAAGTSLVVDARGLKVVPALAPRILEEGGRELYGPASLADGGRRGGAAAYARDLDAARAALGERLGDHPVVVKAVKAQGPDLVLSKQDAAALAGKSLAFLAEGRVVILGGQDPGNRP